MIQLSIVTVESRLHIPPPIFEAVFDEIVHPVIIGDDESIYSPAPILVEFPVIKQSRTVGEAF